MITENTDVESDSSHRLYLSKGENEDIWVNIHHLYPHQVKGIRFLYMNMLKSESRVILNDPSGYGKSLQIVLFLSAIQHKLTKPILIICNDQELEKWKQHFQKWTNINGNNIAFNMTNPFVKNSIHINSLKNLQQFSRRDWGILVVDVGDTTKDLLRVPYKADYIIWVTNIDMKKNIRIFSSIYKWFYPKNKFDIKNFTPRQNDINDIVTKAILLDAFFENIVLRRKDFSTPLSKTAESPGVYPLRISRKRKDITGTKIKRSKKIIDTIMNGGGENEMRHTGTILIENKGTNKTCQLNGNNDDFSKKGSDKLFKEVDNQNISAMDVEDFIETQKPIGSDGFDDFNFSDNNSQHSHEENIEIKNHSCEKISKSVVSQLKQVDNVGKEISFDKVAKNNNSEHNQINNIEMEDVSVEKPTINNEHSEINNVVKDNSLGNVTKNKNSQPIDINNELKDDSLESTLNSQPNEIDNTVKEESLENITKNNHSQHYEIDNAELVDDSIKKSNNGDISHADNSCESKKRNDIDSILADLEAKTMKKYKNSLLDRIF